MGGEGRRTGVEHKWSRALCSPTVFGAPLVRRTMAHWRLRPAEGAALAHRHLERQFRPPKAAPPPRLSEGGSARRSLPAGDQVPRRAVSAHGGRGARLQHRDPWPEDVQRRRHPLQAPVRGRARPAGRRERLRSRAISRRSSRPETAWCGWRASICRTAIRSARRNTLTSSPSWSGSSSMRASFSNTRSRWCWRAISMSFPTRATRRAPRTGSTTLCSCRRRGRSSASSWRSA